MHGITQVPLEDELHIIVIEIAASVASEPVSLILQRDDVVTGDRFGSSSLRLLDLFRSHLFRHIQRFSGGDFNVGFDSGSFPIGL